jgi:hypothetical protein
MFWMNRSAFIGHAVYTTVPILLAGLASMYVVRYSTRSTYYARFLADTTETDWFKIGDMI